MCIYKVDLLLLSLIFSKIRYIIIVWNSVLDSSSIVHVFDLFNSVFNLSSAMATDLRDDKQFFVDHPGAVPITTAQVSPHARVTFLASETILLPILSITSTPSTYLWKGRRAEEVNRSPCVHRMQFKDPTSINFSLSALSHFTSL